MLKIWKFTNLMRQGFGQISPRLNISQINLFPLMSFNEIASKLGLSTVNFILLHVFFFLYLFRKDS